MRKAINLDSVTGWLTFGLALVFCSCVETVERQQIVYYNDFSAGDLAGFENAKLYIWGNDTVVGIYHNEEVALNLQSLPPHDYLKLTVELYAHDSWDGNQHNDVAGPDIWYMGYDGVESFRTTFSNTPCESTYCLYQSYPNAYFRQNTPKAGATQTNLPGICLFASDPNGTTKYSVSQLVSHAAPSLRLFMGGDLKATNSPDPLCDESWSIASIRIEAIQTK